jgi:hypothetical protein
MQVLDSRERPRVPELLRSRFAEFPDFETEPRDSNVRGTSERALEDRASSMGLGRERETENETKESNDSDGGVGKQRLG